MQMMQKVRGGNWFQKAEHAVLRLVAAVFSVASAHAIEWFFSALNNTDSLQPYTTWAIAVAFGLFGYFISRGMVHRLMHKQPMLAYAVIGVAFSFVEISCNLTMSIASVPNAEWLQHIPAGLEHTLMATLAYVVLSIIPVFTMLFAWVDMDMDKAKQHSGTAPSPLTYKVVPPAPTPKSGQAPPFPRPGTLPPMPPLLTNPKQQVPPLASNGATFNH